MLMTAISVTVDPDIGVAGDTVADAVIDSGIAFEVTLGGDMTGPRYGGSGTNLSPTFYIQTTADVTIGVHGQIFAAGKSTGSMCSRIGYFTAVFVATNGNRLTAALADANSELLPKHRFLGPSSDRRRRGAHLQKFELPRHPSG